MKIAIIGASGFLGRALTQQLLKTTDYQLVAYCKSAASLEFGATAKGRINYVAGDLLDGSGLESALQGADVAVYLIHMMGAKGQDFAELETQGATNFVAAAKASGLQRVVYMSGLGDDHDRLSKHLASRHRTGQILRDALPLVLELRASMIIGDGSVAYEIIKAIANKLPIVGIPRWAVTDTQPITLTDALNYLIAAITVTCSQSTIVEIGGPEALNYRQILERYTATKSHRQHVFIVPFIPRWAATVWLDHFVSHKSSGIGRPMVDSLHNKMVVTNDTAAKLFPAIVPQAIESAFGR